MSQEAAGNQAAATPPREPIEWSLPLVSFLSSYWFGRLVECLVWFMLPPFNLLGSYPFGRHPHDTFSVVVIDLVMPWLVIGLGFWFLGDRKRGNWEWPLTRRVLCYRAVRGRRVSVLFEPGLARIVEIEGLLWWAEADLEDLASRFGAPIRRVTVILVPSHRGIGADLGISAGGIALCFVNAVVLSADFESANLRQVLRHELVHLVAHALNPDAHHLLGEGLAVWLGMLEPEQREPSDGHPGLEGIEVDLASILDSAHFSHEDHWRHCYWLTGVFTGYLIERFGWERYRRCYRRASPRALRKILQKEFGVILEDAWRESGERRNEPGGDEPA